MSAPINDVICLGCGCLCDDIVVHVEGQDIKDACNACSKGKDWFRSATEPSGAHSATIDGAPATLDEALRRAAGLLAESRAPLILGLTSTTIEAQRVAVALADRYGALVDPASSKGGRALRLATQRVGIVSATLGEVKNRADVVVYWNCDPVTTHPRHLERYTVGASGRFVSASRRLIVVAESPNTTSEQADHVLYATADDQLRAIVAMRARLGRSLAARVDLVDELYEILILARYGALFFDDSISRTPIGLATLEALLKLVRELNLQDSTRFVALPLGEAGNAAGIESVLGWQAGASRCVDFARGHPRYLPDEADAEARLASGTVDLILLMGDHSSEQMCVAARNHLKALPRIVIAPRATLRTPSPTIAINTAATGIETPGTVMRSDGVMLPLRVLRHSEGPTDAAVLNRLLEVSAP